MDHRTKAALRSMLDDFLDRPPPGGMVAQFQLAVVAAGPLVVVELDTLGRGLAPRVEVEMPTAAAAASAAVGFGDVLDGMECFARAGRVVGQAAGHLAGGAERN